MPKRPPLRATRTSPTKTTSIPRVRQLFSALFDDAAVFPPARTPVAEAVPAHAAHRSAPYGDLLGPFLCPVTRLVELSAAVDGPLRVGVIASGGPEAVHESVRAVAADPRLELAAVEVALQDRAHVAATATALAELLPAPATGYLEAPRGQPVEPVLDVLAGTRHRAKLRTGGVEADAHPSEREVAAFVRACLDRQVAFKATAGLHHAVRRTAPGTGFEEHGFCNLLVAVHAASEGASTDDLEAVLAERDEQAVTDAVRRLAPAAAATVRGWFTSFGTCSVTEPVDDLVRLGLAEAG
jgi:hypothetical protein